MFVQWVQDLPWSREESCESGWTGNYLHESPREKTNNVVSEQVRHKPACTITEDSRILKFQMKVEEELYYPQGGGGGVLSFFVDT